MASEKTRAERNYEARVDLATAYRACNYYNLNYGIFNHITQRAPAKDREGDVMLIVPYGLLWDEVQNKTRDTFTHVISKQTSP